MYARRLARLITGGAIITGGVLFWGRGTVAAEDVQAKRDSSTNFLKQKIIGNYENRLRAMSNPEKVFEYFASEKRNNKLYMTRDNFLAAVTPFAYHSEKSPASVSRLSDSVFKMADADGDGLISFAEYLTFATLLAVPLSKFDVAFKLFGRETPGQVNSSEFRTIVDTMRKASPLGQQQRSVGSLPDPRMVSAGSSELQTGAEGLVKHLFKTKGKISFADFKSMMKTLETEILTYQFSLCDVDAAQTISSKDFARSIVTNVAPQQVSQYAARIDKLPQNQERVTLRQFVSFHQLLNQLEDIDLAVRLRTSVGGELSRAAFHQLVGAVPDGDSPLVPAQVDALFDVFDKDGDGLLDENEFLGVIRRRRSYGLDQPRDLGLERFFSRLFECYQKHRPYF